MNKGSTVIRVKDEVLEYLASLISGEFTTPSKVISRLAKFHEEFSPMIDIEATRSSGFLTPLRKETDEKK